VRRPEPAFDEERDRKSAEWERRKGRRKHDDGDDDGGGDESDW
jgi:hypothetical protein